MRLAFVGGILVAALVASAPAAAADMPLKAPPQPPASIDWSGFYFGGEVGGARDRPDPWQFVFFGSTTRPGGDTSVAIGLKTATNLQYGHIVAGLQSDYIYTQLKSSSTCPTVAQTCTQSTKNIFLTGGRVGFAWDQWLLYAGGGYATANIDTTTMVTGTGVIVDTTGRWHNGWYARAGVEWAWTQSVHFGVEYTHINIDDKLDLESQTFVGFPPAVDSRIVGDKIDMVMATATFKLWSGIWGPFSK